MPKLSKIRLTGCKYDGLRKEHENSIFDLTKEGYSDHALFTLFNGGGKGVMMQLIFQLLLPETKWGKNNGNKVISMFYDQRNNLYPFTFHVVLEWILDTLPEKRLITGIAVKAIIKNTGNEEEEKTGLSYFLYTYEHDNNGYFRVENLPLYDKITKEAVDLDVFENFIDENRRDFTKYSQSSVRRKDAQYYTYLESRGILRSEWQSLKAINKSEGGAGDFFVGASDNKSIFDKIIIPVIGENIRSYTYDDGDSLIDMFKSNLSITKDLPVLIKREADYKELLTEIKPLIDNADSGSRFLAMKERHIDEGNDIFYLLKGEESLISQEIEKWEKEAKNAEEAKKELAFKLDNLEYNKEKRDLDYGLLKLEKLGEELAQKSMEIEKTAEELNLYKVNEILCDRRETQRQIDQKNEDKEKLIEAMELDDIIGRIEEIENEIEINFDNTQKHWKNQEHHYVGYINYINQEIEKNKRVIKELDRKAKGLKEIIFKFELKEEAQNKERQKLEKDYDPMSLLYPERIVEDLEKEKRKYDEKIIYLTDNIRKCNDQIATIKLKINGQELKLDEKSKNINSLNEKIKSQEEYEKSLVRRITKALLQNYDGSLLSHDWFSQKLNSLDELEKHKRKKQEELQRTIWEKSIDHLLNQGDYFIPNKDVITIKKSIEKLGIYGEIGAEYLKKLSLGEKNHIITQYPGFIYSIVIKDQRDWELIEKNIGQDFFINNFVPIYVRSQMQNTNNQTFKTIHGKEIQLIDTVQYEDWKEKMVKTIENLSNIEKGLQTDLQDITNIKGELKAINERDTALQLNQRLKEEENEINQLSDQIRRKREEELITTNELNKLETQLKEGEDKLTKIKDSITKLHLFIEKEVEIEQERIAVDNVKEEHSKIIESIANIDEDTETLKDNQDMIKDSFYQWKNKVESVINTIKPIYSKAEYIDGKPHKEIIHKVPDFSMDTDKLLGLAQRKKALESDIAGRNSLIAEIDKDIFYLNKEYDRQLKEVKKISQDWTSYPHLDMPISEIKIHLDRTEKNLKTLEKEKSKIKEIHDKTDGIVSEGKKRLKNKEEQIQNNHQRPVIILDIADIISEMNYVERDIKSNNTYIKACNEVLEKNNKNKIKLEINLTKINNIFPLDSTKGKMDEVLEERIKQNPDYVVDEWIRGYQKTLKQIDSSQEEGERLRRRFIQKIEFSLEEDKLKVKITSTIKEARIANFKNNLISFKSMENHFYQELQRLRQDKEKAQEAMKQWTHRASLHVMRMVEALKSMVASMSYINEQGYAFPLVKLRGEDKLPKSETEITHLLDEYFVQAISLVLQKYHDITKIEDNELKDLMGDKTIFSKALQGRYPTLMVYKMTEKNEFRYARARDEYYTTWEAINKGEGDLPEGSGGQTLSINTFVIMMLMSFKKKHIGNENPSTVLILDNPFGKASAKHVLDPIFEIANKLNFQLICFAAPEIIKVEISERFPIFWELKIEDGKVVHGGRIIR